MLLKYGEPHSNVNIVDELNIDNFYKRALNSIGVLTARDLVRELRDSKAYACSNSDLG